MDNSTGVIYGGTGTPTILTFQDTGEEFAFNLSTISKVLERLALAQLRPTRYSQTVFCPLQSGFRTSHSTETAVLELLNDVYAAGDSKRFTVVIGLDISAAFDTICHDILLDRLHSEFGISGSALHWLLSYVKVRHRRSSVSDSSSGVPQGSVLGPLLFALYVSPVGRVIESHGVHYQQYADDTQLFLSMNSTDATSRLETLKVGFHYPSSRPEFTDRVDGPRTRVHFLTPVNSGRELG